MVAFTKKCFSGDWDYDTAFKRQMGGGGLVAYLGTSDVQEVERRIDAGDKDADFYFDAMIYQIAKDIGGMATVMNGQVDRVILTGEIARSQRLVERLRRRIRAKRVVAFGDNRNDIPLFRTADLAVCVENAAPEAREAADTVIGSNETDGVARYLYGIYNRKV